MASSSSPPPPPPIVLLLGRMGLAHETVFGSIKKGRKEMRKTILLLGAKNSGKTALVNSVTNYLYKIGHESKYRLHVVGKEKSLRGGLVMEPTTSVHTYVFHGTRVPTSIALVDSPPLGERQKDNKESSCTKIKKWYASCYDHPCKDIEIWLVISAQQPSISKEFMIELKELLEDLDTLHIKVEKIKDKAGEVQNRLETKWIL